MTRQQSNQFDLAMRTFELLERSHKDYNSLYKLYDETAQHIIKQQQSIDYLATQFHELSQKLSELIDRVDTALVYYYQSH